MKKWVNTDKNLRNISAYISSDVFAYFISM